MSKTLMVLAASTYQVPVIIAAQRLGYRIITTDNKPDNPGHRLADQAFSVDTTDRDAIFALARKQNITGIISPGTDVAVETAAYVGERLALPGPPLEAARILTDKLAFRTFQATNGFPCPRVYSIQEAAAKGDELFDEVGWLIKPSRSSGSKGVFHLCKPCDLDVHLAESKSHSLDGRVLIEELIPGTQHTCEGILQGGKIVLALVTDRDTADPPFTATKGHRTPSRLSRDAQTAALLSIANVLGAVGVVDGPFDCDFIATDNRIILVEITPRLGGNSLSALFQSALNFDLIAYAVAFACADRRPLPLVPVEQLQPQPRAVVILGVDRSGQLGWDEKEIAALRAEPWVETLTLDLPRGMPVQPFINGRHRVGEALIRGRDRAEVDIRVAELKRRLALTAK